MSRFMSSIRLEIDGSISHIFESDPSSCPQIELPPFLASVSSIYSGESANHDVKKRKEHKTHIMTKMQYDYVCWHIVVILMAEISILLGILVTSNCSFYSVGIEDNLGETILLDVGLFRYSISRETDSPKPQCQFYGSSTMTEGSAMKTLFETIMPILKTSQGFAIIAPIVAATGCFTLIFHLVKPQKIRGRWQRVFPLLFAALFQLLVLICFDGEALCNAIPDHHTQKCGPSMGSRVCITVLVLYIATIILCYFIPVDESPEKRIPKKLEHNCSVAVSTANQNQNLSQKPRKKNVTTNLVNAQKADDSCLACSPQTVDRSNHQNDVERVASFETSITEPFCSSPPSDRNAKFSFGSDHAKESLLVDAPYDEECMANAEQSVNDQEELTAKNNPLVESMELIEEDNSFCLGSEDSQNPIHNHLVFDLM